MNSRSVSPATDGSKRPGSESCSSVSARKEWKFFAVLPRANRPLAVAWWLIVVLRGVLPAVFAIAMGLLVAAVENHDSLAAALTFVGAIFILLQVLTPIHQAVGANLGDRTAAWLYDRLTDACVRPPGMGHLEDPELTSDLTVARDFDLGMTGPPLFISMDFIAGGLVEMIGGVASALVLAAYAWWAPWCSPARGWRHITSCGRAPSGATATPTEVRSAQRDADYAYRLAVDPPASKELRLFGLASWTIDRFVNRRTRLYQLQYEATRLRERSVLLSMLLVVGANVIVFWALAASAVNGHLDLGRLVMFAQSAIGVVDDRVWRSQLGVWTGPPRPWTPFCGWSRRWNRPGTSLRAPRPPTAGPPAKSASAT